MNTAVYASLLVSMAFVMSPALIALSPTSSVGQVSQWLTAAPSRTMLPPSAISEDISFRSDLASLSGSVDYCKAADQWHTDSLELLTGYKTSVLRISTVDDEVLVRWRAEWAPSSSGWFASLGAAMGWTIVRFDVDPRKVSTFSWRAVGTLLATAAKTGSLRLPASAIEGSARLRLEQRNDGSMVVTSHREAIDLIREADAKVLQNRRCAQDLAMFLDLRRPDSVDSEDWASEVRARVLSGVPGAGALDIEPLADEREGTVALGAFAAITVGAMSAFLLSAAGGEAAAGQVFGESICDEIVSRNSRDYIQCVSDLYTE